MRLQVLAGLALGGLVGAQLWHFLSAHAFSAVAAIYIVSACLLFFGAIETEDTDRHRPSLAFMRRSKNHPCSAWLLYGCV